MIAFLVYTYNVSLHCKNGQFGKQSVCSCTVLEVICMCFLYKGDCIDAYYPCASGDGVGDGDWLHVQGK